MDAAQVILAGIGAYATIGALFAIAFVTVGVSRVDPVAKGAPWSFRVLIAPGAAALWPLMLTRWMRARRETRR